VKADAAAQMYCTGTSVEEDFMGMIRSVLVSLVAVLGWAMACVLMAIGRKRVEDNLNGL
jgi:hypothetical protein